MAGENKPTHKIERIQKSYFDVIGICCSAEVVLVERILKALEGIEKVSVIVPSKTVIVVHDTLLVSQSQIVKALNKARLEATVQVFSENKNKITWPSNWTIACGVLLLLSAFQLLYHPLQWLAVAAALVGLPPILLRSVAAIRRLTLDINILAFIAVAGSIALKDYWEAGSIVFLFTIAEWLESRAGHKATAAMAGILSLAPQKAVLAESGVVVDAKEVKVNTLLAVKAGEVVPVDGVVVDGEGEVDERSLTGEPYPVSKQALSLVWAGTINLDGYIRIRTTATAEGSAVSRMAKLVEEAQSKKSKTQRIIDKCAVYYTPIVVVIAAGVALVPVVLKVGHLRYWFHLALVILVSACPCGLVLSTPVATFCALTKAAKTGILIKGGDYLEELAKLKVVAFDKTGTITKGEFDVTDFKLLSSHIPTHALLSWVSSIECKASHPMAAALVEYCQAIGVEPMPEKVSDFITFPGEGVHGKIDGKLIYIGNKRIASRACCQTVPCLEDQQNGSTEGFVFVDGVCFGAFMLSDACRIGASRALLKLKSMGIKTAMLTGDNHAAAMNILSKLGSNVVDTVHAELLPEEKVERIQELKKVGPTAMVGDGMNDAPALAAADVGISMGLGGSGVAVETGHVTLMSNDIGKVALAVSLARQTRRRVYENISLSVVIKGSVLALALAGHPLLWAAVGADLGTCLLVIFNSMRLLRGTNEKLKHCHRRADIGDSCCTKDQTSPADCCSGGHCSAKLVVVQDQTAHDHCCSGETGHIADHHQSTTDCCSHGHCSANSMTEEDHAAHDHRVTQFCSGHPTATTSEGIGDIETGKAADHLRSTTDCCSHGHCSAKSMVEEEHAAHAHHATNFCSGHNPATMLVADHGENFSLIADDIETGRLENIRT